MTPMNRLGQPDELNGLAVFLASDASGFMTGSNVMCDVSLCPNYTLLDRRGIISAVADQGVVVAGRLFVLLRFAMWLMLGAY